MLSINTNLPSIIAQSSLKKSTLKLNTAVERMSTGFKINSAKDNAANYSISTNMTTKIGAYQVAEENCAMGMDLLSTADESLNLIADKLSRLRALAEQAANGTYGEQSLKAINSEAKAIIDETNRIYNTTEYNGQKLFGHSGRFMKDIVVRDTSKMDSLESVDTNTTITSGTYSISSAEELAKLATMANTGKIQGGEYVLANDIDLSEYTSNGGWTPIGQNNWSANHFKGDFDGNGYIISNLYINRPNSSIQGLFGCAEGTFKNIGIENANITGNIETGALLGISMQEGQAGYNNVKVDIDNCYAIDCNITASGASVGGLVGETRVNEFSIKNCYTDVNINTTGNYAGGLVGYVRKDTSYYITNSIIENCFTTGNIIQKDNGVAGGLIGSLSGISYVNNCSSSVNVSSTHEQVGGFIGNICDESYISNCYCTGDVKYLDVAGNTYGLKGYNTSGFIGSILSGNDTTVTINHCYSESNVSALQRVGGLIGICVNNTKTIIKDSYATGELSAKSVAGGIIGIKWSNCDIQMENTYALSQQSKLSGKLIGDSYTGGNVSINNCGYSSHIAEKSISEISGTNTSSYEINATGIYNGNVPFKLGVNEVDLQVGIYGNDNSQISLETSFSLYGICKLYNLGLDDKDYLNIIDDLTSRVAAKQVEFGAAQNRLDSALDEISTQYENLVSSRSTLKDADTAQVSSEYIRQQILQQASATLLSTANQTPALALQLL